MTAPDQPATQPMPMVTRAGAGALMPEEVNSSMRRRHAASRACVGPDGMVQHAATGARIGSVHKTSGMAWRARDPKGNLIGLHASKPEAAGALVLRHEGS